MRDEAFSIHSYSVILDDNLIFIWEYFYMDHEIFFRLVFESLFFEGIWCIREKFSHKDFTIGV